MLTGVDEEKGDAFNRSNYNHELCHTLLNERKAVRAT
jgi:hypothetical protein